MAKSQPGQHDSGERQGRGHSQGQSQGQDHDQKQKQKQTQDDPQLLSLLEGRPCPACSAGELESQEYKDNLAAVCDSCGTPQAQLWSS
ncbi:HVO_A0556 family zinc finger protein [Natrialba sp. SSL1]|uniref:HVO_A0556 family zinc finger protein n=1 Tax=Natrialba sp. SSL1 TaxID=1869245 RepID=UPI000A06DD79